MKRPRQGPAVRHGHRRNAIEQARQGIFPPSIAADVQRDRLARYFSHEGENGPYRISKAIRDMVVFSEQDVVRDPPFSKLDLVSCRNLLIYLNGDLQKRLIPLFHYSLRPGGRFVSGPVRDGRRQRCAVRHGGPQMEDLSSRSG